MATKQKRRPKKVVGHGLEVTEWDIHIHYGSLDASELVNRGYTYGSPGEEEYDECETTVLVALLDSELVFADAEEDAFVEHLAGALDESLNRNTWGGDGFPVQIRPRILRGALDRVAEDNPVDLAGWGTLSHHDDGRVAYEATCGARYAFYRADLELVLEEFGG